MELFIEALEQRNRRAARQRHPPAVHRRPARTLKPHLLRAHRRGRGAHRGERTHDAATSRSPTAAAGTSCARRGGSRARGRGGELAPAGIDEAALRAASCARRRRPIRTCSSAPAASSASAISCSGTWPTPSSISATRCGRTSTTRSSSARSTISQAAQRRFGLTGEPGGRVASGLRAADRDRRSLLAALVIGILLLDAAGGGRRRWCRSSCWPAPGSGRDLPGSRRRWRASATSWRSALRRWAAWRLHGGPCRRSSRSCWRPRPGGSLALSGSRCAPARGGRARGSAGGLRRAGARRRSGSRAWCASSREGQLLLLFLIVLIAAADVGAYFGGRAFGTTQACAAREPGQDLGRLLGGMLAAGAGGLGGRAMLFGQPLLPWLAVCAARRAGLGRRRPRRRACSSGTPA